MPKRVVMQPALIASCLSLFFLGVAGPPKPNDWADCDQPANPDAAIAACTRIIQSGGEPAHRLSIAFFNRGLAYQDKNDLARAIADYDKAIEHKKIAPRPGV